MVRFRNKKSRYLFIYTLFLFMSILLATCFYYQNNIFQIIDNLCNTIIDITGAQVKTLIVTGASPKVEKLIKANLGIKEGDSIFKLSTTKLLNNLINIGWIKQVSIHKILPNIIKIQVKERVPIAIFYHNKTYTLIDKEGNFIEDVNINPNLPLVSGTDANLTVYKMLEIVKEYPIIEKELYSLIYVRQRRWDIILNNKIKIKLPSCNDNLMHKSLKIITKLLKQPNIQNSVIAIDMRIPENVIIQGLQNKQLNKSNNKKINI